MRKLDIFEDLSNTLRRFNDREIELSEALELMIVDISNVLEDIAEGLESVGVKVDG